MKRFLLGFICSFILALSMVSVALAAYMPVFPNVNSTIYNSTQMYFRKTGHRVLDVDPASASFAYKVQISYDDLSSHLYRCELFRHVLLFVLQFQQPKSM